MAGVKGRVRLFDSMGSYSIVVIWSDVWNGNSSR